MKPAAFDYCAPTSLGEALAVLATNPEAKPLAGGQSLVPLLNYRLASPPLLVDLNRIPELAGWQFESDGSLVVGAMTRHRVFETDTRVRAAQPLMALAVRHIAHGPIRTRGTLGGSLCHADPAAEWPAVAIACDAQMRLASSAGERVVPADAFFQGLFTTAVGAGELLTAVRFPAWTQRRRAGLMEFSRRHGDFAIVGVVAWVEADESGSLKDARVVVFGAADVPITVPEAAAVLVGISETAAVEATHEVARIARARIPTRADHHASAEFRSELIEVLVRRTLAEALYRDTPKVAA